MRTTTAKIDNEIVRIVKAYGGKKAEQMFEELSKFGGSEYKRTMRRVHRLITTKED
jgi:hypothetical protein